MLAALIMSASQVPVMTFFPGLLFGLFAYLYTVFLLSLVLRVGCSRNYWKLFIQGLVYMWTRCLRYRTLTK